MPKIYKSEFGCKGNKKKLYNQKKMETITIFQNKKNNCIKIELEYINNIYYYGLVINLNRCGRYFKAGPIPNDRYPNGKEYPYKDITRIGAIKKAIEDIKEFIKGLIDNNYDEKNELFNMYTLVNEYKIEFINSNIQLTLF